MPDYTKTIIYKLCCKDAEIIDIYIGSTCNFARRKCEHKQNCNNENRNCYNFYVYRFIREHGNFENWDMIAIEEFSCNSKLEKEKRERYWIDELKPKLNKVIPTRTYKEHYKANADKIKEYSKEYRQQNTDKIREQYKEYYKTNADKIKEQRKEYRQQNVDKINERQKEYRQQNADKISEQRKEYRRANIDKIKEHQKEYRQQNADKIKEYQKEYRLLKKTQES